MKSESIGLSILGLALGYLLARPLLAKSTPPKPKRQKAVLIVMPLANA